MGVSYSPSSLPPLQKSWIRLGGRLSQILQLTKSVGGTNAPRADNFSSEAPGAFNMHFSPILAYFFELSGMSGPTFSAANLI